MRPTQRSSQSRFYASAVRGTDRVFYDLDDPVRKIFSGRLIALHPTVIWAEIGKKLTSKSWYDRFYAEHLLEALFYRR